MFFVCFLFSLHFYPHVPAWTLWCYKCVLSPKLLHMMGGLQELGRCTEQNSLKCYWQSALPISQMSLPFPSNLQLLTAGPVTSTSSASSSHSQHDFSAQSNLPRFANVPLEWSGCCRCYFPAINIDITALQPLRNCSSTAILDSSHFREISDRWLFAEGREFNSSASPHCDDEFPPQRK